MKARNEMRKPVKDSGYDELRKNKKLKPLAKEKNVKQTLLKEIDELEDIDINYKDDDHDSLDNYYDDEEEDF